MTESMDYWAWNYSSKDYTITIRFTPFLWGIVLGFEPMDPWTGIRWIFTLGLGPFCLGMQRDLYF